VLQVFFKRTMAVYVFLKMRIADIYLHLFVFRYSCICLVLLVSDGVYIYTCSRQFESVTFVLCFA